MKSRILSWNAVKQVALTQTIFPIPMTQPRADVGMVIAGVMKKWTLIMECSLNLLVVRAQYSSYCFLLVFSPLYQFQNDDRHCSMSSDNDSI